MKVYPNFYESLKEANMRLRGTVVLYDGEPYYIYCVTDFEDGDYRAYMERLPDAKDQYMSFDTAGTQGPPCTFMDYKDASIHKAMEDWWAVYPSWKDRLIRRKFNSPLFNKFRPFPLGMYAMQGSTLYLERTPNRKSEQGLTQNMVVGTKIKLTDMQPTAGYVSMYRFEMRQAILGVTPTVEEALSAVLNGPVGTCVPFHRHFAFISGPAKSLFLVYKASIVGKIEYDKILLDPEYSYAREVIQDLNIFGEVKCL